MIQDVTPSLLDEVRVFLESHLDTSIFLLHCLERFGPRLGEHRDSGNYRVISEAGRTVAVASGTRRGHLLAQTGGRRDVAGEILQAYDEDPVRITGIVAEWEAADAIWTLLRARPGLEPQYEARHIVYRRLLEPGALPAPDATRATRVRLLGPDDFEIWYPLFHALELAEGASIHGDREEVRRRYAGAPWRWYGSFSGSDLTAVACVDVSYRGAGHIGGLYVRPVYRGQGRARTLLMTLLHEEHEAGHLIRAIVHARVSNQPAQQLYESLGFTAVGHFAFLFGRQNS